LSNKTAVAEAPEGFKEDGRRKLQMYQQRAVIHDDVPIRVDLALLIVCGENVSPIGA
jgi:hypothetical protein